jgi:hypothetical protein
MRWPPICRPKLPRQTAGRFSKLPRAAFRFVPAGRSAFRGAESAHDPDDKANQQNQAKAAAADGGTAKIKPAAAEQEEQNNQDQ